MNLGYEEVNWSKYKKNVSKRCIYCMTSKPCCVTPLQHGSPTISVCICIVYTKYFQRKLGIPEKTTRYHFTIYFQVYFSKLVRNNIQYNAVNSKGIATIAFPRSLGFDEVLWTSIKHWKPRFWSVWREEAESAHIGHKEYLQPFWREGNK